MERVLITGASGFVGGSLVRAIHEKGYIIRITSRNLAKNMGGKGYDAIEHYMFDLSKDDTDYEKLLANVDVVIHLAARVHAVSKPGEDLSEHYKINTLGTKKIAKAASVYGVRRFIFLSSVKVNGEKNIVDEKDKILAFNKYDDPRPQGAYAKSKLGAEVAIRNICHESKMDFVILRPTLVYGPGVRANFLSLLDVVNKNYPLPLASVKNKRSLVYVGNLVHVISLCVDCSMVANQTYLISDTDISMLVRKIASLLGKRALLFPFPVKYLKILSSLIGKRSMIDPLTDSLLVDNGSLCKDVNWMPPYSLDEGLQATVDWYLHR